MVAPRTESPHGWADRMTASAALPDQRLIKRFSITLGTLGAKPYDSIPQACGTWDKTKATYRFLENDRVIVPLLLQPISDSTAKQAKGLPVLYAIQDTSSLNYSHLTRTTGLGPINDSDTARGIHLHSTVAVGPDRVLLGLLDQHWWARDPNEKTSQQRKNRPIEDKESFKWIRGIRGARQALERNLAPGERPRLMHVMDREGDIHEVFQEIDGSGDGAVIRCVQNREIEGEIARAHAAVRSAPLLGTHTIDVPKGPKQPARQAVVELRAVRVTITGRGRGRRPVPLTLLELWEPHPPHGVEPLHWLLWTSETVETLEQGLEIVAIYKLRWVIEEVHLVLKSGCHIEALELETAERLAKGVTLYSAIAVRIVRLRDLSRRDPEAPCTVVLSDEEWRVLYAYFEGKAPRAETPPATLRQAVLWIGRLGGHVGRKRDGMPGVRTLWRGLRDLELLVSGSRLARQCG